MLRYRIVTLTAADHCLAFVDVLLVDAVAAVNSSLLFSLDTLLNPI